MKFSIVGCVTLMFVLGGCFIIDGNLFLTNLKVVLKKDNPDYYAKDPQVFVGGKLGTLPRRRGDTIATIGYFNGGMMNRPAYLVKVGGSEVFILRSDVLNPDDLLYDRLGPKFWLSATEDGVAWARATNYIKEHSLAGIEVSNESLIKTKGTSDSLAISYLVTRVKQRSQYEYEIICKSARKRFDAYVEASALSFYMATGRKYVY